MKIITVDKNNIDDEHICCAIGNDKENTKRAQTKKEWLKKRFKDGLVFKRLNERGKIFIEYMPVEKVWKPIKGKNFMAINCLWVAGRFKGQGIAKKLLKECIKDAKVQKMDGIVVTSSNKMKPFLTDKRFYLKYGFEIIDEAEPYFELLALVFNKEAKLPQFTKNALGTECKNKKGFTFIYSNQCPFMEDIAGQMEQVAKDKKVKFVVQKLITAKEAQQTGSAFGTAGLYYNGEFQTHEIMPAKKFEKFIEEMKK
jgi:ribosomal protein S18 acetylase RimI-like enzyme